MSLSILHQDLLAREGFRVLMRYLVLFSSLLFSSLLFSSLLFSSLLFSSLPFSFLPSFPFPSLLSSFFLFLSIFPFRYKLLSFLIFLTIIVRIFIASVSGLPQQLLFFISLPATRSHGYHSNLGKKVLFCQKTSFLALSVFSSVGMTSLTEV